MAGFPVASPLPSLGQMPQANANWERAVGGLADDFAAGQQYGQLRNVQEGRKALLGQAKIGPDGQPNWGGLSQNLLALGDLEGARIAANNGLALESQMFRNSQAGVQNQQWNQQFELQRQNAEQAQKNADRNYDMQKSAAAYRGVDVRPVKNADGSETMVRIDRATGEVTPIQGGGAPGANPYASGKFNEGQGKAAGFADRMTASEDVIRKNENINSGFSGGVSGAVQAVLPDVVFNQFASQERQQVTQAQRDFINAILRKESGAVISDAEFDNAKKQYFPAPGDGPDVIKQKRANRQTAIQGIMREAGPSYRPPGAPAQADANSTSAGMNTYSPPAPSPGSAKNEDRAPQGSTYPPSTQRAQAEGSQPPVPGARQASDGMWYVPDPARPGKYLKVNN